jgi:aspartate ammonia-lyase
MTDNFRTEKDSLGEVPVPAAAYYGAQTQRAINNFHISGLRPWRAFIWSMATIKRAAAEVNRDLGLLDPKIAEAIIQAAQEVIDGRWDDQFRVDPFQAGAGTSHNMNTNEVIANRAIELLGGQRGDAKQISPNDHVNMAQSTNDTIPTAIRLGVLWRLDEMLGALDKLAEALDVKAAEFDSIVKSGRTHLQDAVPIRLGQEFSGYAKTIWRDREKIALAADGLRRLGIGGTATGTGLNAHPEYHARMIKQLSQLTGLKLYESDNLFESMQAHSDAVFFSGAVRTLAQDLIRIANDFRLLSSGPSTGLDEIRLPAVQPGSSIMPGKVNPVMAEMLDMAMFHVLGNDLTVTLAAQAGHLFEMMQVVIGSVTAFTEYCVVGLKANPEKATGWLARNAILVTALNPLIGYLKGAEIAKAAMARNLTIREVALEKIKAGELVHKDGGQPVTIEEIDAVLGDIRSLTEGGIHCG